MLSKLRELFLKEVPNGSFEVEFALYATNGIVFLNDEYGILAKPCIAENEATWPIENPKPNNPNAWFVGYAVGNKDAMVRAIKALRPMHDKIVFGRTKNGEKWTVMETSKFIGSQNE